MIEKEALLEAILSTYKLRDNVDLNFQDDSSCSHSDLIVLHYADLIALFSK